jgi:hypothetical protein
MSLLLKLLPYIAGVVFIVGCGMYVHHAGVTAGRSQIQTKFDAFVRASDAVVAKQIAKNAADKAAAEKANADTLKDYQRKLSDSAAYGRTLANRLRDYLAQANSGPLPKDDHNPSTLEPGQTPSDTGIGERIGAAFAECRDNADQLDALIHELAPQL